MLLLFGRDILSDLLSKENNESINGLSSRKSVRDNTGRIVLFLTGRICVTTSGISEDWKVPERFANRPAPTNGRANR